MGGVGGDIFKRITWLTKDLIEASEGKKTIIFDVLVVPEYLAVTADIVRKMMIQYRDLDTDQPHSFDKIWLEKDDFENAKEMWKKVAVAEIKNGNALDSVDVNSVYYMLRFLSEKSIQEIVNSWLDEGGGIEKIALLIGYCGTDSTNGPYTQINVEDLSDIMNFDKLKNLAQLEIDSGKELTPFLKAVYLSITTGSKYYLNDATKSEW